MQIVNQVFRYLTGGLFIFSGLIKLNDPHGFAYKLEEYFEVFAKDFSEYFLTLKPVALELALFICIAEIVLGVAVLFYYRMKQTTWVLLLMILFFTFLTFYSAAFDKVKECGCFGDFIKLTPWQSFWKDIILLVMIVTLFVQRKKLKSGFNNFKGHSIVAASTVLFAYLGYYSLAHLPFIDWLPFAEGNNIATMRVAEETPRYMWIFKDANGKVVESEDYLTDQSLKLDTFRLLNDPEKLVPKILDYRIWNEDGDFADASLTGKTMLVVIRDTKTSLADESVGSLKQFAAISTELEKEGIKPMILSLPDDKEEVEALRHDIQLAVPVYYSDDIQLKMMLRSEIGFILLNEGTVTGKWHYNDVPDLETIRKKLTK